jgi:hypothetical protein
MVVRFTNRGCKVDTTYTIQPNGQYWEQIELSVDPASQLALEVEENAGQPVALRTPSRGSSRVRSTRFGFELVEERS